MNNKDKIVLRQKGPGSRILGALIIIAGLILFWVFFQDGLDDGFHFGSFLMFFLAGVFVWLGSSLAFYRDMIVLDKSSSTIIRERGYFKSTKRDDWPFDGVSRVTVTKVIRSSDDGTDIYYPVKIDGYPSLNVSFHGKYNAARKQAEEIAAALDVHLVDTTTGTSSVRDPESLSKTLYESVRDDGVNIQIPQPPFEFGVDIQQSKDSVLFDIPCEKWNFRSGAAMAVGTALILIALSNLARLAMLQGSPSEIYDGAAFASIMGFLFAGVPGYILVSLAMLQSMCRVALTIDKSGLYIKKRAHIIAETQRMPASELEELVIGKYESSPFTSLVIRSDKKSIVLCHGQSRELLEWLRDAIPAAIDSLYSDSFRPGVKYITRARGIGRK